MDTSTIELPSGTNVRVSAINETTFRIEVSATHDFYQGALTRYGILAGASSRLEQSCNENKKSAAWKTGRGTLRIDKTDGVISLLDSEQNILTETVKVKAGDEKSGFDLRMLLHPDDRLYGLGDESRDRIQKRGHANSMMVRNVSSYAPIPFLMSQRGWAIFINTTFFHDFDAGAEHPDVLRFHSKRGFLDFFLFIGKDLAELLDSYTMLSGRPQLLPQWAYGLTFTCDERQVRAIDVLNDARQFRREGIPCDMISLEPSWMEKRYDFSVDKRWSPERFHTPEWLAPKSQGTFAGALSNMGFKLGLWMCCDYDLTEYEETLAGTETSRENGSDESQASSDDDLIKDSRLGESTLMDTVTKPGEPWFDHIRKFVDDGACSFKLDGALQVNFHPDRKWRNGMDDHEAHNLYPVIYAKQMANGFEQHTGRRPMIFTSCGYAGIQRYAATWAGDTGGEEKPLVSLLNHGLSGHSNATVDMSVKTPEGIHFGFMQPWSQSFSWYQYNQPWFLDQQRFEVFKFYAKLRYRLIPYVYSAACHASRTGTPICRAMPLMFPDDPESDKLLHQYMLGDFLLTGAFAENFHLPPGEWVNYWTGEVLTGPLNIKSAAAFPPDSPASGPLFVRKGAIVTMWPDINFVGEKKIETILLDIIPGADADTILYEDDGETMAYSRGEMAETKISLSSSGESIALTISPRRGQYRGMQAVRNYHCMFRLAKPESVLVGGQEYNSWRYDEDNGLATVELDDIGDCGARISLNLK